MASEESLQSLLEAGAADAALDGGPKAAAPPPGEGGAAVATPPLELDLAPLDGLRGVCSLLVVTGHFFTFWSPNSTGTPYPVVGIEYLSPVSLFFLISGFTLVATYHRDLGAPGSPLATPAARGAFFRKRVARLAPVYYLSLAVGGWPFVAYTPLWTAVSGFAVTLVGAQSLTVVVGNDWNGPLWTVSAFVVCYWLFPHLLGWMRTHPTRALWAELAGLAAASFGIMAAWMALLAPLGIVLHMFAGFRVPQFAMGVAAGLIAQRTRLARPTAVAEGLCTLMVGNLAACAALTVLTRDAGPGAYFAYMYAAEFTLPLAQAVLLMALAHPGAGGPCKAVLRSPPLRYLGAISYSLYCLHWPLIVWAAWAAAGRGASAAAVPRVDINGLVAWWFFPPWAVAPVLGWCLAVAAVVHRFVEAPARATLRGGGGALRWRCCARGARGDGGGGEPGGS